ncbi:MAG: Na+/H+ antiporter subunit E [Azonexus sp.]
MIGSMGRRALLFAGLWWVLAEGRHDGWLLGSVAVMAATWASLRLAPAGPMPLRLAGLFGFLRFFIVNSVRGGIQVAGMALRGKAALQPGLVELAVGLPAGGARVLLINTLSLMPGTVGVDMDETMLRLHVLDERLPVIDEARALETAIGRLFGRAA